MIFHWDLARENDDNDTATQLETLEDQYRSSLYKSNKYKDSKPTVDTCVPLRVAGGNPTIHCVMSCQDLVRGEEHHNHY